MSKLIVASSWRWSCASVCRRRDGAGAGPSIARLPNAEAAADALTAAIRKKDDKALTAILGSTWHEFAPGGDQEDEEIRAAYLKAWDESHEIMPQGADQALFGAGTTGWVAPLPTQAGQ